MKQRRGWLWLASGLLLALLAGLMTFQIVNDLAISATMANNQNVSTIPVIVAAGDIEPFTAISTGMVTRQEMPTTLVPQDYTPDIEGVIGKISMHPITAGEVIVNHRLADPADPNTPVLYTMDSDQVVIAMPATTLMGELGMLTVGGRIDIAYTNEFEFTQEGTEDVEDRMTTFLSLQNLEVKGLLRRSAAEEGIDPRPDAVLLAVSPQEALILKYLIDSGSPMDLFLRSPENSSLMTVVPVDQQYLIDYFQLDSDVPVDFASRVSSINSSRSTQSASEPVESLQSLIRTEVSAEQPQTGE